MAKAQVLKKKQAPKKQSKILEKQGKSTAKTSPKSAVKAQGKKDPKAGSKGHPASGGSGARTQDSMKNAKSAAVAKANKDSVSPKNATKSKSQEHEKASEGEMNKASKSGKTNAKANIKAKAKKKIEQEDDLLVGEAEGSDDSIEGLDEIEELETEILEGSEILIESTEILMEETDTSATAASDEPEEIILTDAEGRRLCQVRDCDQAASVESYCRFHYLQNWKRIQVRRKILADGKLERYVEELTSRYPDKFLEMIRKDLRSEKDFLGAIAELEIDESGIDNDFEDESQSFIEEVRGVTESGLTEEEEF